MIQLTQNSQATESKVQQNFSMMEKDELLKQIDQLKVTEIR